MNPFSSTIFFLLYLVSLHVMPFLFLLPLGRLLQTDEQVQEHFSAVQDYLLCWKAQFSGASTPSLRIGQFPSGYALGGDAIDAVLV